MISTLEIRWRALSAAKSGTFTVSSFLKTFTVGALRERARVQIEDLIADGWIYQRQGTGSGSPVYLYRTTQQSATCPCCGQCVKPDAAPAEK